MADLLILGAGGFGRTVREMTLCMGKWDRIMCLDDASRQDFVIGKCGDYPRFLGEFEQAFPAFGDNAFRLEWVDLLMQAGYKVPVIIHPTAFVSPSGSPSKNAPPPYKSMDTGPEESNFVPSTPFIPLRLSCARILEQSSPSLKGFVI